MMAPYCEVDNETCPPLRLPGVIDMTRVLGGAPWPGHHCNS